MDQLICASLSHTHYWYEVGMLKVPAKYIGISTRLPRVVLYWYYLISVVVVVVKEVRCIMKGVQ